MGIWSSQSLEPMKDVLLRSTVLYTQIKDYRAGKNEYNENKTKQKPQTKQQL